MNDAPSASSGRLKRAIIVGAVVATLGFGVASVAVRVRYGHLGVRARLADAVAAEGPAKGDAGQTQKLDLNELAKFPWNNLFVFPPYTPRAVVAERVDLPSAVSWGVGIDRRDDVVVLVFAEGRKYSAHVPFPRAVADFATAARVDAYPRDRARFNIVRVADGPPRLVPVGQ